MYSCLDDFAAAEREAAAALAAPDVTEPARLVMVPGARALAWFESGRLAEAADTARAADADAQRLGFSQHFFAVDICARCPASRWNAATSTPRSISPNKCSR